MKFFEWPRQQKYSRRRRFVVHKYTCSDHTICLARPVGRRRNFQGRPNVFYHGMCTADMILIASGQRYNGVRANRYRTYLCQL